MELCSFMFSLVTNLIILVNFSLKSNLGKLLKIFNFLFTLIILFTLNIYIYILLSSKFLWVLYLTPEDMLFFIIILKFSTIFIRIRHYNYIACNTVTFVIKASKVHLFFYYTFIFYTLNTSIKIWNVSSLDAYFFTHLAFINSELSIS